MKKTICFLLICLLLAGCADLPGGRYVNPTYPPEPEPTMPPATLPPETTEPAPSVQVTEPAQTTAPTEPPTEATPGSDLAEIYVDAMTLRQQVAQMFLIICPSENAVQVIENHHPGGIILFARDTARQTPETLSATLRQYQSAAKTPLIIAVDEEGGTVTRISSRTAFRSSKFPSPRSLYWQKGLEGLLDVEEEKCRLLSGLGINVNLAPVCDVVSDTGAFMADRSLQLSAEDTGEVIAEMVKLMNTERIGACLKHFPGYGNCTDTHVGTAVDDRSLQSFRESDFIPFKMGIEAGAGSVMVSHNIVTSMDPSLPASLSPTVHKLLREDLGFNGVIITDDLSSMSAITDAYGPEEAAVLAVLAGNDMLITSWSEAQLEAILDAVEMGRIAKSRIRESAIRIVQWKIDMGLF